MQHRDPQTITALWRQAATAHGPRPFVTDLRDGNRTELSGHAFTQWVHKVANYLEDELPPQPRIALRLPATWLWPVCVAAVAEIGGTLVEADADAVFSEELLEAPAVDVFAVRVHPMALPFGTPLPQRHLDFFLEVRSGADFRTPAAGDPQHVLTETTAGTMREADCIDRWSPAPTAQRLLVRRRSAAALDLGAVGPLAIVPWLAGAALVIADPGVDVSREGAFVEV